MKPSKLNSFKALFSLSLVAVLLACPFTVQAKSMADYEKEKDKIEQSLKDNQAELNALKKDISNKEDYVYKLQANIQTVQDKVTNLESQKAELQKDINQIQKDIDQNTKDIKQAEKDIEKKQAEFDKIFADYNERLRAMYISGNFSTIELLLESGDIASMLTRAEMLKAVSKQDSDSLSKLMTTMEEIKAEKEELEAKKSQLEADKTKLDDERAKLQASIDEITTTKAELKASIAECNAEIKELSKTKTSVLETIHDNQAELDAIEEEIKKASQKPVKPPENGSSGSGGTTPPAVGKFHYPSDYRYISAGYPNYPSGRYHGGIDFPLPIGNNIYAAEDGEVVIVKRLNYSYGHYIMINHAGGLSTIYGHNSNILVNVGDKVKKGQVIAKSGNTGNSTGPHCHFEVRLNGQRVNPLSYL